MNDADTVAVVFCRESKFGIEDDPQLSVDDLASKTGLERTAIVSACRQLADRRLIRIRFPSGAPKDFGNAMYHALQGVFDKFDKQAVGSDPQADARTLAAAIPNTRGQALNVHDFIREKGWTIRRVNPAVAIMLASGTFGSTPNYVGDGLVHAALFRKGMF